jgi:hypothetical protein
MDLLGLCLTQTHCHVLWFVTDKDLGCHQWPLPPWRWSLARLILTSAVFDLYSGQLHSDTHRDPLLNTFQTQHVPLVHFTRIVHNPTYTPAHLLCPLSSHHWPPLCSSSLISPLLHCCLPIQHSSPFTLYWNHFLRVP